MRSCGSVMGSLLIIGFLFLLGGIFTAMAGFQLQEYFASADWPSTEGNITHLSIDEDYDSDDGYSYRANIEYEFRVKGADYYGNRHLFGGDIWSSDRGRAERIVDEYEMDESVLVYYNPEDPNANVLVREVDWLLWLFLAIGIIVLLAGFGVLSSAILGGFRGANAGKQKNEEVTGDLESDDFFHKRA
jgi:hypothetical protein